MVDSRIHLAERTQELYAWLLSPHVAPTFGTTPLSSIGTPAVGRWYTDIAPTRPTTAPTGMIRLEVPADICLRNPYSAESAELRYAPSASDYAYSDAAESKP